VRFSYSNGNARNDHALLHYGFVNRDQATDPLLCCLDEGGDLWSCPDPDAGLLARAEKMNEKGESQACFFFTSPHTTPTTLLFSARRAPT